MPAMKFVPSKAGLCLTLLSMVLLSGLCFAQPSVTTGPHQGPPTSNVSVVGSGFPAYTVVDIYFDTTDEALATTSNAGAFTFEIGVPASALPGIHYVTAVSFTGEAAQTYFIVNTAWAQFHFAANHRGLNSYENVLDPTTVSNLDLSWNYLTGNAVFSSPALFFGSALYVGSEDGNVYLLNSLSGLLDRKYNIGGAVFSSPAVFDGWVFVGSTDDNIYALVLGNLSIEWKYPTGNSVTSSPAVANGVVYIGSADSNVYALNARIGTLLWQVTTGGEVLSSPAVDANQVVYVGSEDGNLYALNDASATSPTCIASGLQAANCDLWQFPAGVGVASAPALSNGLVFFGTSSCTTTCPYGNSLLAVNAKTGALLWQFQTGGPVSSPAVADGVVYIGSFDGNVYAVDAFGGYLHWKYTTGGPVTSSPAVANGVLYIGSFDGNLYAIDLEGGYELWRYATGGAILSSPAVANGQVYVGSSDNNVYAFSLPDNPAQVVERPDPASLRPNLSPKE
ncbi:MAG TPA: PQQ-binding-like beta-propeller repeat protein [Verrucomicrobiae bacterium]|nr:PQQ-binding-like beta-propeller repeat protein [Verrucomicrobiae bacterium]